MLHDADFGSMESWDSWGQEPSEINGLHTAEVNQETWLMLEYCDKGSLLVSKLLLGGMGLCLQGLGCCGHMAHAGIA